METIAIQNVVHSGILQVGTCIKSLDSISRNPKPIIDSFHNALYRTEAGHEHQLTQMQIRTATMVIYMTEVDEVCYTDMD